MTGDEIRARVREHFGDHILAESEARDMHTLVMSPDVTQEVCTFLRDDPELDFKMLTDLTAIDWDKKKDPRFELVTLFWSPVKMHRLRIKWPLTEAFPEYPTLSTVYKVANWLERELWDMFGIRPAGHPNLRRILCHEEFEGHALRKEYPVNRRQPIRPAEQDLLTLKPYPGKGDAGKGPSATTSGS